MPEYLLLIIENKVSDGCKAKQSKAKQSKTRKMKKSHTQKKRSELIDCTLTVPGDGAAEAAAALALLLDQGRHFLQKVVVVAPLLVQLRNLLVKLSLHLALEAGETQEFRCRRSAIRVRLRAEKKGG